MESAKIYGSEEEYRSSESGWTMYLVSPSHDHHEDYYYGDDDHHHYHHHRRDDHSDDGDSMASDASSGPMEAASSLQFLNRTEETNSNSGLCLTKKTGKPVMKTKRNNKKKKTKTYTEEEVKEDRVFTETRVPKLVQRNDEDDEDDSSDVHSCVGSVKLEGLV